MGTSIKGKLCCTRNSIEFSCVNPIQGSFTCPTLRACVCNNFPSIICHKWRNLCRRMYLIVYRKFCCCQPLRPILLPMLNKESEILLQFLIHPLSLSICLRMKHRRQLRLDSQHPIQLLCQLRHELRSSI